MGFDTELFVQQPVDSNLLCGICHAVLEKPTAACEHSHVFCKECLQRWETRANECPTCRDPIIPSKMLILPLQNMILALQVRCTENAKKSDQVDAKRPRVEGSEDVSESKRDEEEQVECCDWEGTLSDFLDKHRSKSCLFGKVQCPFGCDSMILVRDLEAHKSSQCRYRIVVCERCKAEVPQRKLWLHDCPEVMSSCEFCGAEMLRKLLGTKPSRWFPAVDDLPQGQSDVAKYSGHYKNCPKVQVKCDFYDQGCHEVFPRMELEDHHAKYGRKHAQLVAAKFAKIEKDKDWYGKDIDWRIPESILRGALLSDMLLQESQRVRIGEYEAFLRLTMTNGQVCVFACVDNPDFVPRIDRLQIGIDINEERGYCEMKMEKEQIMDQDISDPTVWKVGGSLLYGNIFEDDEEPNEEERPATIQQLLQWCRDDSLNIGASFRLKAPGEVILKCMGYLD